jgi:hypothetical protein
MRFSLSRCVAWLQGWFLTEMQILELLTQLETLASNTTQICVPRCLRSPNASHN